MKVSLPILVISLILVMSCVESDPEAGSTDRETSDHPITLADSTPQNATLGQSTSEKTAADTSGTPKLVIEKKGYRFTNVVAGQTVSHDFIIHNQGTAPLYITRVKTGWGCTIASYTRQIPPGGEGKVSLKVSTSGYPGKELRKNILVSTNDPVSPGVTLTISGHVDKFATIQPQYVRLSGQAGQEISRPVTIIPEKKYAFKILETKASKGRDIRFALSEKQYPQGNGYQLTIENTKTEQGRYNDVLSLKTDSTIQPVIKIRVYGRITAPEDVSKITGETKPKSE